MNDENNQGKKSKKGINKESIKKAAQNARDVLDGNSANVTPYPLPKKYDTPNYNNQQFKVEGGNSKDITLSLDISCDHTQLRNNVNTLRTLGNIISLSLPVNPNEPNIVMINPEEFKFCYKCGKPL